MTVGLNNEQLVSNAPSDMESDYREELPNVTRSLRNRIRKCGWNTIQNRLPILKWLPKYEKSFLFEDFVAGFTVGLTAIPQSIAYAVVAGLQPQYGLYSAFIGCFVYIIFGSCKDVTVGPTAIMSLMVQRYVVDSADYAILACFLTGCVIFLFGLLNLGFLVQFISAPVTVGFTAAASITIASGQINSLLGIASKSNEFIPAWENFFKKVNTARLWDSVLGISTIIFLLFMRKLKDTPGKWKFFGKYASLSRNALAVIIGTTLAYLLNNKQPFNLTGEIKAGFPPIRPPPFSTNTTNGTILEINDMVNTLGSSIIAIPLVSILELVAIAKAFSKGKAIDATQEMIALGLCNIAGSFVSSMPVTGSFTRTAVNNASGVRTTLGGLITGIIVLLALGLLTQTFYFIPKATLAAIILTAMFFMIEFDKAKEIWKSKKIDVVPLLATLVFCLVFGLEYGILCGITVNIIFILYETARPKIDVRTEKINEYKILVIRPSQGLVFSSSETFHYKVIKEVMQSYEQIHYVVIDGKHINSIDTTVALNLVTLRDDLKLSNCHLLFWNWNKYSTGIVYRLNHLLINHFKNTEKIVDAIQEYNKGCKE